MADDDHEGRDGELPEDIPAFIRALQRGDRRAWMWIYHVVLWIIVRTCRSYPRPGYGPADLAQNVMIELAKPNTLARFRGVSASADAPAAAERKALTPRAYFRGYVSIIIKRQWAQMIAEVKGPALTSRPKGQAPDESTDETPEPPTKAVILVDIEPYQHLHAPHLPLGEQAVYLEQLLLASERLDQLDHLGHPWSNRFDWFRRSVYDGQTYKEVAATHCGNEDEWTAVRDGIHKVRVILWSDRARYERGESVSSILATHPLGAAQDERVREQDDEDETRESERHDDK